VRGEHRPPAVFESFPYIEVDIPPFPLSRCVVNALQELNGLSIKATAINSFLRAIDGARSFLSAVDIFVLKGILIRQSLGGVRGDIRLIVRLLFYPIFIRYSAPELGLGSYILPYTKSRPIECLIQPVQFFSCGEVM
jgi:hypothetical protein